MYPWCPCSVTGKRSFPVTPVRTIELFFQVDFHRSSAGARPVIGGRCRSNYRRPVSICRSDYFVPPKRGGREPRLPACLSPAICNFLPILLSRAACACRTTRRVVTLYFVRPSLRSTERRASVLWRIIRIVIRCNLIVVTNTVNAILNSCNPLVPGKREINRFMKSNMYICGREAKGYISMKIKIDSI